MVDFASTLSFLENTALPSYEEDYGSPAILLSVEEREWGWIFHCKIKDPTKIPQDLTVRDEYHVVLIDKENGNVECAPRGRLDWKMERLLMRRINL